MVKKNIEIKSLSISALILGASGTAHAAAVEMNSTGPGEHQRAVASQKTNDTASDNQCALGDNGQCQSPSFRCALCLLRRELARRSDEVRDEAAAN